MKIIQIAKAIIQTARVCAWSAASALRDAGQTAIAWFFISGAKAGIWELCRVCDGKRATPKTTKRLENIVMWSGIITTSLMMLYGAYKLALWRGWIIM